MKTLIVSVLAVFLLSACDGESGPDSNLIEGVWIGGLEYIVVDLPNAEFFNRIQPSSGTCWDIDSYRLAEREDGIFDIVNGDAVLYYDSGNLFVGEDFDPSDADVYSPSDETRSDLLAMFDECD